MRFIDTQQQQRGNAVRIVLILSLALNVVLGAWLIFGGGGDEASFPAEVAETESPGAPPETASVESSSTAPATAREAAPPVVEPVESVAAGGVLSFCGTIEGSLIATLQRSLGATDAELVAAHVRRVLMWDVDLQRDLLAGDRIAVLYETGPAEGDVTIHCVDFTGGKVGRHRAVRYQVEGEPFPRYFDEKGAEIQLLLDPPPIKVYEQVTDLLGGARHHDGVDFKAPLGTEVYSPFAGTILRKNWNWRYNGNCLEIDYPSRGLRGIFLHMEKFDPEIHAGTRVKAGQKIGYVGNTGRTTAAHLHYQLNRNGKPVNPFDVQKTHRRTLQGDAAAAFKAATADVFATLELLPGDKAGD